MASIDEIALELHCKRVRDEALENAATIAESLFRDITKWHHERFNAGQMIAHRIRELKWEKNHG